MTTHPGLEGFGVLGPDGVDVIRWRFIGETQEHSGRAPDPPYARPIRVLSLPTPCVGLT